MINELQKLCFKTPDFRHFQQINLDMFYEQGKIAYLLPFNKLYIDFMNII